MKHKKGGFGCFVWEVRFARRHFIWQHAAISIYYCVNVYIKWVKIQVQMGTMETVKIFSKYLYVGPKLFSCLCACPHFWWSWIFVSVFRTICWPHFACLTTFLHFVWRHDGPNLQASVGGRKKMKRCEGIMTKQETSCKSYWPNK